MCNDFQPSSHNWRRNTIAQFTQQSTQQKRSDHMVLKNALLYFLYKSNKVTNFFLGSHEDNYAVFFTFTDYFVNDRQVEMRHSNQTFAEKYHI